MSASSIDLLDIGATIDGRELRPLVLSTETSGAAEVTTYTDQCGHEEADQNSAGNAQHTIEGLFNKPTIDFLYELYKSGDRVTITLPADIDTVGIFVTDITVRQGDEEHSRMVQQNGIEEAVWHTQVQLKQSGAIDEGQ